MGCYAGRTGWSEKKKRRPKKEEEGRMKHGSAAASLAKASGAEGAKTAGVAVTMSKMARSLEATGASETPQIDTAKVVGKAPV